MAGIKNVCNQERLTNSIETMVTGKKSDQEYTIDSFKSDLCNSLCDLAPNNYINIESDIDKNSKSWIIKNWAGIIDSISKSPELNTHIDNLYTKLNASNKDEITNLSKEIDNYICTIVNNYNFLNGKIQYSSDNISYGQQVDKLVAIFTGASKLNKKVLTNRLLDILKTHNISKENFIVTANDDLYTIANLYNQSWGRDLSKTLEDYIEDLFTTLETRQNITLTNIPEEAKTLWSIISQYDKMSSFEYLQTPSLVTPTEQEKEQLEEEYNLELKKLEKYEENRKSSIKQALRTVKTNIEKPKQDRINEKVAELKKNPDYQGKTDDELSSLATTKIEEENKKTIEEYTEAENKKLNELTTTYNLHKKELKEKYDENLIKTLRWNNRFEKNPLTYLATPNLSSKEDLEIGLDVKSLVSDQLNDVDINTICGLNEQKIVKKSILPIVSSDGSNYPLIYNRINKRASKLNPNINGLKIPEDRNSLENRFSVLASKHELRNALIVGFIVLLLGTLLAIVFFHSINTGTTAQIHV
ncbi:hypothetical protein NEOKW01_0047 [Nematocida sp. AWRm80]|nr:hypothetical protein NEOKW01_0047 [Nematocida sp. AWRm80]